MPGLKELIWLGVVMVIIGSAAAWVESGRPKTRAALITCVTIIIVAFIMLSLTSAWPRDRGQFAQSTPQMKLWFDGLRSGKGPCCSDADGSAVSDVDWKTKDGHYVVRLEGQWVDVPPDAVITEPNRAGRTMVWPTWSDGNRTVRCFMPGSMI